MTNFLKIAIAFCIPLISSGQEQRRDFPSTLNYNLDLKIDYTNEKIYGDCELLMLNDTDKPIEKIPLLLFRQIKVMSAMGQAGNKLKFAQDIISIAGWEKLQVNFIEITLDNPLLPGQKGTLKILYEGFLSGYSADGWRYVRDHISRDFTMVRPDGFGYPVIGYPTESEMMAIVKEKYDYTVKVTVPANLRVVTGGELTTVDEVGEVATYSFRSRKPSWRIDIAIADYHEIARNRNKVFCLAADTAGAKSMLAIMEQSVKTYSEWFGDIKDYKGYTIIEVPEGYGSQADVTSFCLTADNFKNRKDNLGIYHELAHLWDVKPLEAEPCRFESEGRAQFLQFLLSQKFDNKKDAISGAIIRYLNDIQSDFTENPRIKTVPVKDYGVTDLTEYSYTLGMIIFALYYDLAGEENFNNAIRQYVSAYSQTGATLDDFVAVFSKHASFNTQKFFNDWIYSTNGVNLIVSGTSYEDIKSEYNRSMR